MIQAVSNGESSELLSALLSRKTRAGAILDRDAIYRTFHSLYLTGRVDEEILDALQPSLKSIFHSRAGYEQIDTSACTAREVYLFHTSGANKKATADTAVFLILIISQNSAADMDTLRAGIWHGSNLGLGDRLQGKRLGSLEMERIGHELAKRARASDMEI